MKTNYQIKKLDNVGQFINGKVFKSLELTTNGLPIIRIQNLNNASAPFNYCNKDIENKYHVYSGDILISWSASIDIYVWNREHALLNQHIFKVILNEDIINKDYFIYIIKTKIEEMNSKSHGATMKHIIRSKFLDIQIPLPSLKIQNEIVKFVDKKFERLSKIKQLQEASISDTEKILAQKLHKIFKEGKDSGWEEKKIKDICEHPQYGFTAPSSQESIGPKMLRITDIQNNSVNWNTVPYCKCENSQKYQLKTGDIVFARTGATVGKSFLIKNSPENSIYASYLIRLRTKEGIIPEFLYYFFQSSDYWGQITKKVVGGAQPNVNGTKLATLKLCIPSITEQKKIIKQLDILLDTINKLKQLQKSQLADFKKLEKAYLKEVFE